MLVLVGLLVVERQPFQTAVHLVTVMLHKTLTLVAQGLLVAEAVEAEALVELAQIILVLMVAMAVRVMM
jgi:hypothetical protein